MPKNDRRDCPYCKRPAEWYASSELRYGFDFGPMWICRPCGAYTADKPGNTLANAEVRVLRREAHKLFDELWQAAMKLRGWSQGRARSAAYLWLSRQVEMRPEACHMSRMQAADLRRVLEVLRSVRAAAVERRRHAG